MSNRYEITQELKKQLKTNSSWFFFLGLGLVALGTLALIFSYTSTIFSMVYLGVMLTSVGIFEGIKSFKISQWGNFLLHIFLCIFYTLVGLFIVFNPLANALTLTFLISIFLIISGILRIIFAVTKHVPHKNWLLFNGIITLVLGIMILARWPASGLWVIGMFVAIDMIFTGWTWIQLSLIARKI